MVNIIKPATTQRKTIPRPLRIAVLAYAGCMGTQVFGLAEVLRLAADIARTQTTDDGTGTSPPFDIQVIGLRRRQVTIAGGNTIATQKPVGHYDLLIVPGLEISRHVDWNVALEPLNHELTFLRKTFAAGTPVASVCVGAFLLGEAGLLDGRKATTAWLFASALAQRYPAVTVDAASVLLEDAGITTTGAVSSAFDLAIHLVKRTLGAAVATATARVCLLPDQRTSQSPFVDTRLMDAPGTPFAHQAVQWLGARLHEPFQLARMAQAFCVSSSTLMRRVKTETGHTPLALLQKARVERAKQLLHTTRWSLARITEAVGYADTASFSRLFSRWVGESPARYRHRRASAG